MFDYQTAECAAVGCILIDERCLPLVREVLPSADAFANEKCRSIYEVVCGLADKGKPIDLVTVGTRTGLENRGTEGTKRTVKIRADHLLVICRRQS